MKRIVSLIVAVLMLFPNITFAESKSENIVSELGILDSFEDGTFRGEMYVTNGEFIKALSVILTTAEENLSAMGYIREELNKKEALKTDNLAYAMVKLLGYPEKNYQKAASEAGLYKNVSLNGEYITREMFSVLVYNALTADKFTVQSIKGDKVVLSKKSNILKEQFNIERITGIVTADSSAYIGKQVSLNEGEFLVNNTVVRSNINTMDYFGKRVEAFVKLDDDNNNEGELVFIQSYKNEEIKVTSEYIDGATANNQLVWLDYATEKPKKKVIPADAVVIRNNLSIGNAGTVSSSVLTPSDGDVTLIDNDTDGAVDVVIVWDYTTYITDHVNINNEVIYDKTGRNLSLKDRDYFVYDEKGKRILLDSIKPFSVLSVADNGNELVIVSSAKEPVSGTFLRDGYSIKIDGDKYSLNGYCYLNNAVNGDIVKVYLDKYNRATYVVKESDYKYAFLTKTYYSNENEEELVFKMYTFDEGVVKKDASDSITVRDELSKTKYRKNKSDGGNFGVLYGLISSKQELVKYKTNAAGKIRELVFATSKIGYEMPETTDGFEAYYGISTGTKIKSREAKYIQKKFVSKYIVTPQTLLLSLEQKTNGAEESLDAEKFKRITTDDLTDDSDYYVRIYDVNEKFEAGIVVIDKVDDWYTKLGSIVENVSYTLDDYGEECLRLDIYTGGEKSFILSDNPDMQTDSTVAQNFYNAGTKLSEITVGDVIYYKLDGKGKISSFAVLHKNNNSGFYHRSNYGWGGNYIPNAGMAVTYFNVIKTYSDLIVAEIDGARPIGEYTWRNYYLVEKGKLRKAEFSDVKQGDKVLGLWKWSNMNDMIIYR